MFIIIDNKYERQVYILRENITMRNTMITKRNVSIIQTMILQPHEDRLVVVGITGVGKKGAGSNFKLTSYSKHLVEYYHKQYMAAHKMKMSLASFVHIMCKYFGQQEPWIFKDGIDKKKFSTDVLYAIQSVKKVFNWYVPDTKIKTQSDALISLIAWSMSRNREQEEGVETKGFVDYIDRDDNKLEPDIEDFSKVSKDQAKQLMRPQPEYKPPTLEDLYEETPKLQIVSTSIRREK